ncbi:MAG: ATP-binding protein, partial [Chromatiales bacterium]
QGAGPSASREILRAFLVYRILLAGLLVFFALAEAGPSFLGHLDPAGLRAASLTYLLLAVAQGVLSFAQAPPARIQALLAGLVDVGVITFVMYVSGGVETGLGMLLAVSIAAGGSLVSGRVALFLAAAATLAVLGEQVWAQLQRTFPTTAYTQSGVLGAAYFAIAGLAHVLSDRLRRTEQLASRRGLDLANLAQLNDYIIQHMRTGVLVLDDARRLRLLNGAAWRLLGMPEDCQGAVLDRIAPGLANRLARWRDTGEGGQEGFRALPQGKDLRAAFAPIGPQESGGTLVFLEDAARVTEQAQALKLASLGRLTASIAHEVRNPLAAIGHAGQLLEESDALPNGDRRLAQIIRTNTGRVNGIIESILQLSRRDRARPEAIRLGPWLEELAAEIRERHRLPRRALHVDVSPPDTHVLADPGQLRQIVINLCENSVRHFDREAGELRVRVAGGVVREAGGPVVDICDNGPGIAPDAARQIFEPFFTTGRSGTGLGLYIARELGEANGIRLEHLPTPLGGTCFRMLFSHPPTGRNAG